jgi:hypothetical protein
LQAFVHGVINALVFFRNVFFGLDSSQIFF